MCVFHDEFCLTPSCSFGDEMCWSTDGETLHHNNAHSVRHAWTEKHKTHWHWARHSLEFHRIINESNGTCSSTGSLFRYALNKHSHKTCRCKTLLLHNDKVQSVCLSVLMTKGDQIFRGYDHKRWRSQSLRRLRRGSAAARLLGLRVRILPGACMSVPCECVCCQVWVSASGRSLVQRSLTECGVSECDIEKSTMRKSWPTGGCCAIKKKGHWKVGFDVVTLNALKKFVWLINFLLKQRDTNFCIHVAWRRRHTHA
jgi:hypothetical protein